MAGKLISHDRASRYKWLVDLAAHPNIITDGVTRKLEHLVVTTIPYHCSKKEKSIWLDRGSIIRKESGKPWIVFHHVPPKRGPTRNGEEAEASDLLLTYQPEYFVSGHDHGFPYLFGQSWQQSVGAVCLLVPGQLLRASYPNYIKLNTDSGESSWHTDPNTSAPEGGRFDHLLLNLDDLK